MDVNENALQFIVDWLLSNHTQFTEQAHGQRFGMFKQQKYLIYPTLLTEVLTKSKFSPRKTYRFLADKGYISTDTKGKYSVNKWLETKHTRVVEFHFDKVSEMGDFSQEQLGNDKDEDLPF